MTLIAQMMPGMEWIPLIAMLAGLIVLIAIPSLVYGCLRKIAPNIRIGIGAWVVIAVASLFILRLLLPTPVSESHVIESAKPGMTVDELISKIGEPHEKHLSSDGSGTLHYCADYIGYAGIGVIVNSDGTVDDIWVE